MRNYLGGCRIPCFYVYALQMCDANGCLDCRGGVQRIDLGNCATCVLPNTWLLTSVSTLGHVISRTKTCEGWINVGCTSKKLTHWTATKMRWTQRCPLPLLFLCHWWLNLNAPSNINELILSFGNLSCQTHFPSELLNFFILHYHCEQIRAVESEFKSNLIFPILYDFLSDFIRFFSDFIQFFPIFSDF